MRHALDLDILAQPTETTCGPTCLHAIYRYWGDDADLPEIIAQTGTLKWGGTLAVLLACHALARGYRCAIHTFNLEVFDPSWFGPSSALSNGAMMKKLSARLRARSGERLSAEINAYLEFLDRGGKVIFEDLTARSIATPLRKGVPILAGLSATYLYRQPREYGPRYRDDDVRGDPSGHFVVLRGLDPRSGKVVVADPLDPNPPFHSHSYKVGMERLICSILLGVLTYDANMLLIQPQKRRGAGRANRRSRR